MKDQFSPEELVEMLRQKMGASTQTEFAAEIGISFQMLSDIFRGRRSVANPEVLAFLAPKGHHFEHRDIYVLVANK